MPEAEIIPIGTNGPPGRGSGRTKPSAAARGLAGGSGAAGERRTPRPPAASRGAKAAAEAAKQAEAQQAAEHAAEQVAPAPAAEQEPAPTPKKAGEQTATSSSTTTHDRGAIPGIPLADWKHAIESGAREVLGGQWERRLAELMSFTRRRLEGNYEIDDFGFDAELTERLLLAMLRPLAEKWFRIEVRGIDNIPDEGGALVVSNHSGTVPIDALMTMVTVHDQTDRFLRPLGADLVFRLPVVAGMARRLGATLACQADAERMLTSGELVGVWPEGFKGIGKPFTERYKLQRFGRGGFVSAALRTGVPIVPLSVVGAEEIYPIVGNLPTLARMLNLPYVPITPFFPLLGPLGLVPLPSKWLLEFGEPIRTDAYEEAEAEDPMLVFNLTDQVRETIQQTLFSLLLERDSVFG
ncbi:lysophospholipid acyltransferase family protein [Nocardioides daphniae]|uniref:Glycerol acyltransferase n=1 Tax=Nocardioides daphniae TaxID=402297 RepID=A0ABQ1QAU6_9ACTN|nr:lysophospholipid acyltransferase family protein [Nocardioides daphniae]GGD20367.1 glycerol acyltransferase [Nocardioides daphniae]